MAAYAALVSLMNNIEQIQSHTRLPIRFDQTQSEALLDKVNSLIDFLETYNYRGSGEEMKDLESRMTDAAYAAEDIIETHVVDRINAHSKSLKDENKIMLERIPARKFKKTIPTLSASQAEKNTVPTMSVKNPIVPANSELGIPDIEKLMEAMKISIMQPGSPINASSSVPVGKKRLIRKVKKTVPSLPASQTESITVPATSVKNQTLSCIPDIDKLTFHAKSMQLKDKEETEDPRTSKPVTTNTTGMGDNEMITAKNPTLSCLEKVMEDMHCIKEAAMKLKDRNETQDLHPTTPIIGPSSSSIPAGKNTTVGFDDELKRITELLLACHSSRQVIPIVGMGGIGKTTLAKTAYEKFKGGKHFDFCAWVSISQQYDLRKIVLGLLPDESTQMSDNELGQRLHQKLYKRRYLIVLDDMWSVEAWERVMRFLPDNNNGSRIIVTTRESSVSSCFGKSSIKMSFLDEDQSWNLFCEKVFAPKGCPHELEEVGRKIVINCKGLPLSIVVIGGLLAKSERTKAYWDDVARDIKTRMSLEDDGQCMEILSLSYWNLPVHLKPCFLYIGAFPEDEEIRASVLIKLWGAEGFLKSESSKGLEELAETYLNDLISRNLILIHGRRKNGKVKYCMIHDLMRDLCLKIVKNEKFMYASNTIPDEITIGSHRRISIHESSSPQVLSTHKSGSMLQTRTLIFTHDEDLPQLQNFRLLRVLNVNMFPEVEYSLHDTFMLVNLRLIAIDSRSPTKIPSSICLSWNLRILILENCEAMDAPLGIWEMTELRHLEFLLGLNLPDPPPSQQINTQECDVKMKNLQTLKTVRNFRLSDEVVKRIPNIKKLKILYDELEKMGLEKLGLLKNLESLYLSFYTPTDSDYRLNLTFSNSLKKLTMNLTFPNSLKKLTLSGSRLEWEDMPMIASIPHLEVLKLKENAFIGPEWELDDEEKFPCLKYLQIYCCYDLKEWIADDINFPVLEHLVLEGLRKLVEIPSGIGDIPTLQLIELDDCSKSAVTSAKRILEEQENLGNVGLKVTTWYCTLGKGLLEVDHELESLACDNFKVQRRVTLGGT